jgi:arylsulfatase A-like enzyme
MMLGTALAVVHLLLRPLHRRWRHLRIITAPIALLIALFLVHWLNVVVFDAIHAYVALDGADLLVRNARLIYQRMLPDRSMTAVLFEFYYPTGHILALTALVAALLARPRLRSSLDAHPHAARRLTLVSIGVLLAVLACTLVYPVTREQHERQALCGSATLAVTLSPGCARVLPVEPAPPTDASAERVLAPYRQRRQSWPSAALTREYRRGLRAAGRPGANVLLVLLESVSARHLGAYGARPGASPVIDGLARGCTRYLHALSTSNITGRGIEAVFGGLVRPRTKVERDPEVHPVFPELLGAVGYETAFFGAALGMEESGRFLGAERWGRFFDTFEWKSHHLRPQPPCEDDCHMLREVDAWLKRRDAKRPFLLVAAPYSTHFVYKTPDTWPVQFIRRRMEFYSPLFFPRSELETVRDYHANAVRYVDFFVGELLRMLSEYGVRERTLVILTADHGEDLYTRSEPTHGTSLYDGQVHVPLLVCVPGQGARVEDGNVSHVDIAPTVLDWSGLPPYKGYEGMSLLAGRAVPERALFLVSDFLLRANAVVVGRHKYLRDLTRRAEALHDRAQDPHERVNLVAREPSVLRAMRWILQDWLERSPF